MCKSREHIVKLPKEIDNQPQGNERENPNSDDVVHIESSPLDQVLFLYKVVVFLFDCQVVTRADLAWLSKPVVVHVD